MVASSMPSFVKENRSLAFYWSVVNNENKHACKQCQQVIFNKSTRETHEEKCSKS